MLSRKEIQKEFIQFLSFNSSLPSDGYLYLSNNQISCNEIDEFILNSQQVKIITNHKNLSFPGWLGVVYLSSRFGKKYDVYFLSQSGEFSLLLMTNSVKELETILSPISGWDGTAKYLQDDEEEFTQPSFRLPIIKIQQDSQSKFKIWWEKYRANVENYFVFLLTFGTTALTVQFWFHWIVAIGVFLSFLYLQTNFENQKLNPQTALKIYTFLYGKEMCWIVFFIATHSYSGLLSPFLTMLYAPYRNFAEKLLSDK